MSDELDKLRAALTSAPPAPDPGARAETLRLAMENFERHQETAEAARPKSGSAEPAGILTGVRAMLSRLTTRGALAATASIAVVGVGVMIWPALRDPDVLRRTTAEPAATEAPKAAAAAAPAAAPAPEPTEETAGTTVLSDPTRTTGAIAATSERDEIAGMAEPSMVSAPPAAPLALGKEAADSAPYRSTPAPQVLVASEAPAASMAAGADAADTLLTAPPRDDTEVFANAAANPVKIAAEEPVSTFSIDTDTASWSILRSSLMAGVMPPKDAVRIEEMVNYFPYDYAAPAVGEAPFRASVSLFATPWNKDTELLRIGLQGALPAVAERPPLNLVFLIDTSGSMEDANKLPLLKQSFRLMLGQLRPEDRVAIVTYAGSAGLELEPTPAADQTTILAALDRLGAGGSTAGAEGLEQAYAVAEKMGTEGHVSRILLATDGDFNVGIDDPEKLKDFIAKKRASGIYLSVLGFGRGNLDDATMQALAQNGNGTAAYIDTLGEARKVLVDQLSGALFPIADDVKIQLEFNPAAVAEYRLIGYETRALAREDFNNDRVDAGEIGAGHQVTALYEITPVGSPAHLSDPLRYAAAPEAHETPGELGFLKLRYKAPGATTSTLVETPISARPGEADTDARFAAAIAGMGQLLGEPKYLGSWGWDDAIALASGARGEDPFGYRIEAVNLMRLAQSLSR
ncbi:MAG: VWA domain-containing protein [Rhodobacteraceae bacterium]|nr:VWA domain-containing protein [Paracoccaceae bacterium]